MLCLVKFLKTMVHAALSAHIGLCVDINDALDVPPDTPVNRANPSALLKLLQLDAAVRPGLTQAHFRSLFVRCTCGLIMTRRAYCAHYCVKEPEVIDLTDIDDSETEVIDLTTATDEGD
jgi:hypothetical protein